MYDTVRTDQATNACQSLHLARKRRAKPWQNQGSEFGFSENPGSGFSGSNAAFRKKALEIISDYCIIFCHFIQLESQRSSLKQ
jgi:hypothetical protein